MEVDGSRLLYLESCESLVESLKKQNAELEQELKTSVETCTSILSKYHNLKRMFDEVHDNERETREKKKEVLKWGYSLEKENAQLKQKIEDLETYILNQEAVCDRRLRVQREKISKHFNEENEQLKQDYKQKIEDMKSLENENFNLQNALQTSDMNEEEADYKIDQLRKDLQNRCNRAVELKQENENKTREIIELKTKIVEYGIREYRLTQILNETSDHT